MRKFAQKLEREPATCSKHAASRARHTLCLQYYFLSHVLSLSSRWGVPHGKSLVSSGAGVEQACTRAHACRTETLLTLLTYSEESPL